MMKKNKATKEERLDAKIAVGIMKKAIKDTKKMGFKIVGVRKA